jgi:hypothetical protein
MEVLESIKKLTKRFEDSCRIPYTWHHDYLRKYIFGVNVSRAKISNNEALCPTHFELWATCLIALFDCYPTKILGKDFTAQDYLILKEANKIVNIYIKRIKHIEFKCR